MIAIFWKQNERFVVGNGQLHESLFLVFAAVLKTTVSCDQADVVLMSQ